MLYFVLGCLRWRVFVIFWICVWLTYFKKLKSRKLIDFFPSFLPKFYWSYWVAVCTVLYCLCWVRCHLCITCVHQHVCHHIIEWLFVLSCIAFFEFDDISVLLVSTKICVTILLSSCLYCLVLPLLSTMTPLCYLCPPTSVSLYYWVAVCTVLYCLCWVRCYICNTCAPNIYY